MRSRTLVFATIASVATLGAALAASPDTSRVPRPRPVLAGEADTPPMQALAASTSEDIHVAPLPRSRPSIEPKPEVADWAAAAEARFRTAAAEPADVSIVPASVGAALAAIDSLAPLPRPRPDRNALELALMAPPRVDLITPVAPEDAACVGRLRALGVKFTEEPPLDIGGACAVPHPLKVTELGSGIAIVPEAIVNCATAESLALWVKKSVTPSATRMLGAPPTKIVHSSAYVCRTRYNDPEEKISEHARANAVDIASLSFADRDPVAIGGSDAGSIEARFEAEIRAASCEHFTTVLGPGSNAAHETHFHLDMAFRRGGYRLCELGAPTAVAAPANTKRE